MGGQEPVDPKEECRGTYYQALCGIFTMPRCLWALTVLDSPISCAETRCTPLTEAVVAAFAAEGELARVESDYRARPGQLEMALAVARTIEHGGALVVEAGTGVGKTFSYLVPALLSGERVLLSTATKALQDQLFGRDLPRLVQALGLAVRIALLKGRASYLCLHRLELARQDSVAQDGSVVQALARIETWAQSTRSGDLAELPGLDERSAAIALVTSTRDNCLGSGCPQFRRCHVNLARREALAADVVVINHHLFFADVAVRESGVAELLPTVRVVVFDEAHQVNETGVLFLGTQLGTGQLLDLARDLLATGMQCARGMADWQGLSAQLERAARDLRLLAGKVSVGTRLSWLDHAPEGLRGDAWGVALGQVLTACRASLQSLEVVQDMAPDFVRLQERVGEVSAAVQRFAEPCAEGAVRWADVGLQLRLVEAPLDIAQSMRERLQTPVESGGSGAGAPAPAPALGRPRAWVFTSATLGDDERLRWFTEPCGLEDAEILRVQSPFDYAAQAAVYVPRELASPSDPAHSLALANWVADAAARLGGRTLVLTTTLKALRVVGHALQECFAGSADIEVLVQGQGPKRRLMDRFRTASQSGQPGCILVASATFWEGFDVPGDALQMVVIDKLPFPPPGDPLVQARSQRLQLAGRSPFKDLALPEAAVALKQGAGRLIRHESDRGVLVIGDTRLLTKGYGKRLWTALPPMRRLQSEDEFNDALQALTRTSTTDHSCL